MEKLPGSLLERLEIDSKALESQTQNALKLHEQSLQDLSLRAQDIFKTASERAVRALEKPHVELLKKVQRQGANLAAALEQQQADILIRHRSMMLWPLVSTILICLILVVGSLTWSTWKVSQADDLVNQKQRQIQHLEAQFCASPAGRGVCK